MNTLSFRWLFSAAVLIALPAAAAGKLEIRDGWIRSAPPAATMLAGYGTLHNAGDTPLTIRKAAATGFTDTSLHESVLVGDVSRMQAIGELVIAAGASVEFKPGGKHLMLMDPTAPTKPGNAVVIRFELADGSSESTRFIVRDEAASKPDEHAGHDHHPH